MKRPLVVLTIFFCLGIIIASLVKISLGLTYLFAVVILALSLLAAIRLGSRDTGLLLLSFLIGALHYYNSLILPDCHISHFCSYKNNTVYALRGFVNSQPEFNNNRTVFIFATEQINFDRLKANCCGNVLVFIKGRQNLDYGSKLILQGSLYRPFNRANYVQSQQGCAQRSYADYLASQGIYVVMQVRTKAHMVVLAANKGQPVKRFAFWLKKRIEEIIYRRLSLVPAAIIDAMVLGEKRNISPVIYKSMMRSGTVHILVVSGFNVGLVVFCLVLLLKLLRIPRRMRFYVALPLIIIYCLITGASNPVLRATIMAIVFMFAYLVKGEPDIYISCCLAALFILIINPRQLFDVGFQLSFASVIAIVWIYPRIKSLMHLDKLKIRFLQYLADGFLVSFSAWVGTMGFIAYYFKMVSPITVFANLFIVPLACLINLCGFCLVVCEFVSGYMVLNFASVTELLVKLLLQCNSFLISLPKAYFYLP
jgi:competence protein ComEC